MQSESSTPTYRAVTPFLFLGGAPQSLTDVRMVKTASEAARVISQGGSAVLPSGAWDEAEEALHLMSPGSPHVAKQMHFAKTGSLDLY